MRLLIPVVVVLLARLARAQEPYVPTLPPPEGPTLTDVRGGASLAAYLGGALTGFVAHESGHLIANLAYDNPPALEGLTAFGFLPFFAITPRISCIGDKCYDNDGKVFRGGRRGKFVIVSAGYNVQHLSSELFLTLEPDLRHVRAPFRKGWIMFNVLLSAGYALATWTRTEDDHGDAGNSARLAGIQRDLFGVLLLAPAALDLWRLARPGSRWAPWLSRGAKAGMVGAIFSF